ncbi:hypothetical protein [Streptomyces sp. R33]|uniref:Uncharacterized protein n=1 Tax=Streptomyces sp. R33 TaxID=3238629 RepID=A0AB39YAP3_9ACTN
MHHQPTDLPRGDRHTVRVVGITIPQARPGTVEAVLLAAASVIQVRGLHHGDYVADPFNWNTETGFPACLRPMSAVGAIRYAATGSPQATSQLADTAVHFLALSLDGGPVWTDPFSLERHVEDWSDGLSAAEVVAALELTATAPERAA